MKYQELENICRMEPATFKAAFVLLVGFGAGRISNVCIEDIHGDELPQEEKAERPLLGQEVGRSVFGYGVCRDPAGDAVYRW